MKRILVLAVVGILLILPITSADDSGSGRNPAENELHFTQFPQVYVNASSNDSFNVSFVAALLFLNNGAYVSLFPNEHWLVNRLSNNSISYTADLHFSHIDHSNLRLLEDRFNVTNLAPLKLEEHRDSGEDASVSAHVAIYMNKTLLVNPVNRSSHSTGFDIIFVVTSSTITGPGDFILIQELGAKIHGQYRPYHTLVQAVHNLSSGNETGLELNSNYYDAYYWWSNDYILNGHHANISYQEAMVGPQEVVVFKYQFNSRLQSLYQDPYFAIPQIDLFKNPIIRGDIQNATQYFVIHAELFIAGIITGGFLLGITYGSFRRRRI